tara:strand:+ start:1799 stop:2068 length:270 start_codon:yes stop_codon:yes gene_type:complete
MELKSITIDNEGIITIHTDKGIKKIHYHNPFYQAYRTQLETISFQAYQFDDKKNKFYQAPKSLFSDDIIDNRDEVKRPNGTYFNDEWNK